MSPGCPARLVRGLPEDLRSTCFKATRATATGLLVAIDEPNARRPRTFEINVAGQAVPRASHPLPATSSSRFFLGARGDLWALGSEGSRKLGARSPPQAIGDVSDLINGGAGEDVPFYDFRPLRTPELSALSVKIKRRRTSWCEAKSGPLRGASRCGQRAYRGMLVMLDTTSMRLSLLDARGRRIGARETPWVPTPSSGTSTDSAFRAKPDGFLVVKRDGSPKGVIPVGLETALRRPDGAAVLVAARSETELRMARLTPGSLQVNFQKRPAVEVQYLVSGP